MIKVSFGYDSTLDNPIIQEYARELIHRGLEVWIVTSRMDNKTSRTYLWNRDLFLVADELGIKPYNIHFCNMEDKYKFFQRTDNFLWHLDDDKEELDGINDETTVVAINSWDNDNWRDECENIINKNITTLYRPVGPKELSLIKQSDWKEFPPRLPEQPIFYPVMNKEYAIQVSKEWNVPAYGSGYVLRFFIDSKYIKQFKIQNVGGNVHNELWIPAEKLDEFNSNIIGKIEVIEKFYK